MVDDAVIGTAVGLTREQVEPFLRSLRKVGYSGRVVLFVDSVSLRELRHDQLMTGVTLVRVLPWLPARYHFVFKRRAMRILWAPVQRIWWTIVSLLRHLVLSDSTYLKLVLPIASVMNTHLDARFLRAFRYLRNHPHGRVLLCDVRDVLFQDDPFTRMPATGLAVGLETSQYTLATQPMNAGWITRTYGRQTLDQIGMNRVSNVGVTYGDGDSIMHYLGQLASELLRLPPPAVGIVGADTAIHNVLLWTGRLGSVEAFEPLESPVATLNSVDPMHLKLDPTGRLLNLDGSRPSILHQYDRQPAVREALLRALTL